MKFKVSHLLKRDQLQRFNAFAILTAIISLSLSFPSCSPLLRKSSAGAGSASSEAENVDEKCPLSFAKESLCAQIEPLESTIDVGRSASFQLTFWDPETGSTAGPYADLNKRGLRPFVRLWMDMPSGPHGSHPVGIAQQKDAGGNIIPGIYRVWRAIFSMAGLWEIQIELYDPDGTKVDEAIHKINI